MNVNGSAIGCGGHRPACWAHFVRRLIEITSRRRQTLRTLLDWLRVEYAGEKSSKKLPAVTELDSDA